MMYRQVTFGLGLVITLMVALACPAYSVAAMGVAAEPSADAAIVLKTSSAVVSGCAVTRVEIWATDVSGLYGVDVRIKFDPAVLQVVDADPAGAGTQITPLAGFLKPDFVVRKVACNAADPADPNCPTAGVIWYAATQTSPTAPASGSGAIAAVDFVGKSAGQSLLQITHSEPVDIDGAIIPAGTANDELAVAPPASPAMLIALPAPTTVRLTWTGVSGASGYRLYRGTAPYFTAAEPAYQATSLLSFDDTGAVGDADTNHFYVVAAGCSAGLLSEPGNRTGEFDFALTVE